MITTSSVPYSSAGSSEPRIDLPKDGSDRLAVLLQPVEYLPETSLAFGGRSKQPDAAVVARLPPLDQARVLGPLDQLGHCGLLKLEQLAKISYTHLAASAGRDHQQQVVALRRQTGPCRNRLGSTQKTPKSSSKSGGTLKLGLELFAASSRSRWHAAKFYHSMK
jgi:hypothetical protein